MKFLIFPSTFLVEPKFSSSVRPFARYAQLSPQQKTQPHSHFRDRKKHLTLAREESPTT